MNEVNTIVRQEVQPTIIESITKGEIDIAIATAHRFPRSVSQFKEDALSMATLDSETAESCFYHLERKDKDGKVKIIEGPSVRFAEIVGSCWGNMRYGARIVSEESGYVVAQGVAHDLEKNVTATLEVRRKITTREGKRYSDDMVTVNANAACAIVLRNAIFKVIPKGLTNDIYETAVATAVGDIESLAKKRQKGLDYFGKLGVKPEQVLAYLGKAGLEDIDLIDIKRLLGLVTALKEGDTTIEESFPNPEDLKKAPGVSGLKDRIAKKDEPGCEQKQEQPQEDGKTGATATESPKLESEAKPEEKKSTQPELKF